MTAGSPYELVLTPPAVRAVRSGLPEAVAAAVVEFLTGTLVDNPHRVGKRLRGDLSGIYSARRGSYRVLYRINEERREVVVLRVTHRSEAYGPLSSGTVENDEQVQHWADDAERGFSVGDLARRGRGRPGRGAETAQVVAVRLTEEESRSLDRLAAREHISRSEALRRALAQLST